jgi:hypothetical protein
MELDDKIIRDKCIFKDVERSYRCLMRDAIMEFATNG